MTKPTSPVPILNSHPKRVLRLGLLNSESEFQTMHDGIKCKIEGDTSQPEYGDNTCVAFKPFNLN